MKIKLTSGEYNTLALALLNLSQDIRFAAQFQLIDHETLKAHLLKTHENVLKIDKLINDGKLSYTIKAAELAMGKQFGDKAL